MLIKQESFTPKKCKEFYPLEFCWYKRSLCDTGLLQMSTYLSQAILLEVSVHPKPGLVTSKSNGSHNDMSIMTFAMSSAVVSRAFFSLQNMGLAFTGTPQELMEQVRIYGIQAEKGLLSVTKGINTQKGILFSGGILSAAAGYAVANDLYSGEILSVVRNMTDGIVERELRNIQNEGMTAGEILYQRFGITGIRGEVALGFPSVVEKGMPALQEAFSAGANLNNALIHTLLSLMTVVEDSNIIWRTDLQTALQVKQMAADILAQGSVFTSTGKDALAWMEGYFIKHNISPGGSADLLSITIALYLLANKEFPVPMI